MPSTDPTSGLAGGARVEDWLESDEAKRVVNRVAARWQLEGFDAEVDTVLSDARFAVWLRMQSPQPLEVRNPAAYGTTVIKSVLRDIIKGRSRAHVEIDEAFARGLAAPSFVPSVGADDGDTTGDDLRVIIERMDVPRSRPWLTASALAYLTLLMHPEELPEQVPQPRAGATPDQARGWAALWLAGQRDLFPDHSGDPRRKTRSRRVRDVLDHLRLVFERYRFDHGGPHG